jgi:hypothetical protein
LNLIEQSLIYNSKVRGGGGLPLCFRVRMTSSEILMAVFTAVIATTGVIGALIFNNQLLCRGNWMK